jgi:hypothetical protein
MKLATSSTAANSIPRFSVALVRELTVLKLRIYQVLNHLNYVNKINSRNTCFFNYCFQLLRVRYRIELLYD